MPRMSWVVLLITAWATCPGSADACSPPMDGGPCEAVSPSAYPAHEATGVPLNTEVRVTWLVSRFSGADPVPSTTFRLVTEAGEVVALEPSPTSDRWRPVAALAPNTTYLLEDQLGREPTDAGFGCSPAGDFVEVARFVTGTERDDTPPALPGAATISDCCHYTSCTSGGCCGPWTAASRSVSWEVDADTSVLAYRVGDAIVFAPPMGAAGWAEAGMFGLRYFVPTVPTGSVEVRAIDGAGNVSAWTGPVSIAACSHGSTAPPGASAWDDSCTSGPRPRDAGPMDASAMEAASPSGCAVGRRGSAFALALGVTALAALVRRRSSR